MDTQSKGGELVCHLPPPIATFSRPGGTWWRWVAVGFATHNPALAQASRGWVAQVAGVKSF